MHSIADLFLQDEYLSVINKKIQSYCPKISGEKINTPITSIVVYEKNSTVDKETNNDKNVLEVVLEHISTLKDQPRNWIEFRILMKMPNDINEYASKFNTTDDEYIESIGKLFEDHESLTDIQKILEIYFPIFTQDIV